MSQIRHLLPRVDRYFKANLHAHSTISDGKLTVETVKEAYREKGYSILCMTDHNVVADHSELNEPDFLMLTGVEINTSQVGFHHRMPAYHLNLIAKRPDLCWQPFRRAEPKEEALPHLAKAVIGNMSNAYDPEAVNAAIAEANRQGFLVTYNHPGWSLHGYRDYAPLKGLWGMEICNFGSMLTGYHDRDNARVYRDFLELGNRLVPLGTDDCHRLRDIGGAWVMVGAEKLEYASVIEALEKGNLYASTGPEILGLSLEGDTVTVRCSDARSVVLESNIRFARSAYPANNDGLLREAKLDISPWRNAAVQNPDDWFRITVCGPYGHYAATRAYFRDELESINTEGEPKA